MSAVFADTAYYIALLNSTDPIHQKACEQTASITGPLVTTDWVLVELGNYLCQAGNRRLFSILYDNLKCDAHVTIVPASPDLLDRGITLYRDRVDKDWSLTDCISFVVMEQYKLKVALTVDHHFEQSGFTILLK